MTVGDAKLTWSLTPHSPAGEVTAVHRRMRPDRDATLTEDTFGGVVPSPPGSEVRGRSGQGLLLSRTMLSNH